jgi:hypothetical protein
MATSTITRHNPISRLGITAVAAGMLAIAAVGVIALQPGDDGTVTVPASTHQPGMTVNYRTAEQNTQLPDGTVDRTVPTYEDILLWESNTNLPSDTTTHRRLTQEMRFFEQNTWLTDDGAETPSVSPAPVHRAIANF